MYLVQCMALEMILMFLSQAKFYLSRGAGECQRVAVGWRDDRHGAINNVLVTSRHRAARCRVPQG